MTRLTMLKLAASATVAVAGFGMPAMSAMASGGEPTEVRPERAARSAERATRMMERNRMDQAIRHAEEAVAYDPTNAEHRSMLGQMYLAAGRFVSAEESFAAARELGANDSRTVIGHALTMIAAGNARDAVALVDENMAALPASDYGLALALAGEADRGALVLIDVVRAGDATARDRQNLALAFALAGRWLESQLLAAQDVGADRVDERMAEWSAMAQSGDPRVRIAGVLGATISDDPGMPVQLALNGERSAPPVLALNDDPAPIAMYAPPPPGDPAPTMDAQPMDVADATASYEAPAASSEMAAADMPAADMAAEQPPVAVALATDAPMAVAEVALVFVSNPVIQPLRSAVALAAPGSVDAPAPAAAPTTVSSRSHVGWAVQLGSFASNAVARSSWASLSSRHAALSEHQAVSTSATVNGRSFVRLSATGFASRGEAAALCDTVRSNGGNCFVRQIRASENVRWTSNGDVRRLAAR